MGLLKPNYCLKTPRFRSTRIIKQASTAIIPFPAFSVGGGVSPGSYSQSAPGMYTWVCPNYNTLNLTLNGATGGGGGVNSTFGGTGGNGGAGTDSNVNFPIAVDCRPGQGGGGGPDPRNGGTGAIGTSGTASGPSYGTYTTTGNGGNGGSYSPATGGIGGPAGKAIVRYTPGLSGAPTPGASYTIVIGSGGAGGTGTQVAGTGGVSGSISMSWS